VIDWDSFDSRLRSRLWRFVLGLALLALAGWFGFLLDLILALLLVSFVYLSILFLRGISSGMRNQGREERSTPPGGQPDLGSRDTTVVGPPEGDWRAEEGYGWIFKAWFRSWGEAREAMLVIAASGWEPKFWGRKVRVYVKDGYDGDRLVALVTERWPETRIQLRND